MTKHFFFILIFLIAQAAFGQKNCQELKFAKQAVSPINNNGKSDTIDILHYHIALDATAIPSPILRGVCKISFSPKINGINKINLDLVQLTVDSVFYKNTKISSYSYGSGHLRINLPATLGTTDTANVTVFYLGTPVVDGSGWGGFHFNSPYFYNLGVGFAANPHTFGRAWFPCFDNFVEKSSYTFAVKTRGGLRGYCNGMRTQLDTTTFGGDTVVSHWQMTNQIPTYLASVAISDYQEMWQTHNSMPMLLLGRANDTSNIKGSFANLPQIYDALVGSFGPYQWQKVGYAVTIQGAMEHATCIHYPRSLVNGNLNGEDIVAHELAHHWWGNLVTCKTAADMWINEGMAEYASQQYQEVVYNRGRYLQAVKDNHAYVIQYAAVADGGHFALYDLPNNLTYGKHTYQKGAMIAHNLRAYLGDSLFFGGLSQLLANNAFVNLDSYDFRDQLSQITSVNLTPFFTDWIFNPGYPEFNIDSLQVAPSGILHQVKVGVSQRMRATTKRFTQVPIIISLKNDAGQAQDFSVNFANNDTVFTLNCAFAPTWATLNEAGVLLEGHTSINHKIKSTGNFAGGNAKMDVVVTAVTDSALLRVEHHWAGPSRSGKENFRMSDSRYWRVTGVRDANFTATARLDFSSNASNGNLDQDLLANGVDSLILVYRKDATQPWAEYPFYQKVVLSATNKSGRMQLSVLQPGEYAFANGVTTFGLDEQTWVEDFKIFPNPAKDSVNLTFSALENMVVCRLYTADGTLVSSHKVAKNSQAFTLDISGINSGNYYVCMGATCLKFVVIK